MPDKHGLDMDHDNADFNGIRKGLKKISEYYDIDYDQVLDSFCKGARDDPDFAEQVDPLRDYIIRLDEEVEEQGE